MHGNIIPFRREGNGRLKRPTMAEIRAAEADKLNAEKATVANQPHRKGDLSQLRESELGRFVLDNKLRSELYLAGNQLFVLVWSWRAAIGCPMPLHIPRSAIMNPDSEGMDAVWNKKINKCYAAIQQECGKGVVMPLVNLCVHDEPVSTMNRRNVIDGLAALAVELGQVESRGFVPFLTPGR
jgi:hypothetical protein